MNKPVEWTSLALDRNGRPVVAYTDEAREECGGRPGVLRYDATNTWVQVGDRCIGGAPAKSLGVKLALDRNNMPYLFQADETPADGTAEGTRYGKVYRFGPPPPPPAF